MFNVRIGNEQKQYDAGITYGDIAKEYAAGKDIILARSDGKLVELNKKLTSDCEIKLLDTSTDSGHKTYVRGVTLLMLRAFYKIAGDELKNILSELCYWRQLLL